MDDVGLSVGETLTVKFLGFDPVNKKPKISRKALLSQPSHTKRRISNKDFLDIIQQDNKNT